MILRWSRPSDPCLVLGSALAVALPFGGADLAAQAQTPTAQSPSPPAIPAPGSANTVDALKRHDKELDAIRAKQRQSVDSQATLKSQIDALSEDHRTLTEELIASAARVRDVEGKIEAAQTRLRELDRREQALRKTLDERRSAIIEILAALERVGRDPPPALLVRPEDALGSLRTAITLGSLLPDMRARAAVLVADLSDLLRVRKDIVAQRAALSQNLDQLAFEQLRLNMLVEARQKKQAEAERALASEKQHAVRLAQQADNLKDLIAKLETSLNTSPAARAVGVGVGHPDLAALHDPGRLTPAVAFADLRGRLHLPVNGLAIREFGDPNGIGGTQKGVSIAAEPGAEITSPCDSWVVYAGPFRSYGQLLILNAGGGYHVLLAGMERISVDLGQFVLTGEPVAVMGGQKPVSAAVATGSKQPVLYVEFRKGGTPIDPSPWWATNEGEKVRG
jgi:septal ring factor EnvC (AmiA/AmiB activator)